MSMLMACDEPAATVESNYLAALPRATDFVAEGGTLLISAGDEQLLRFVVAE